MATSKALHRVAIARVTAQAPWRRVPGTVSVAVWLLLLAAASPAVGQAHLRPCPPVSERTGEPGPTCSTANQKLGRLPQGPIFWHLDTYSTRALAEAAKGPRGSVVESLGKIWLFTIAEAGWHPSGGERVAEIGPLLVTPDTEYTAVYLESIFDPGMTAPVHTHSGPEAFYTLTGESCLEIPDGVLRERGDGHTIIVPGGPPMLLTATGTVRRRGVVLILHDSSQPANDHGF
jgi:quercetin dioxygenase-like cupin family protein